MKDATSAQERTPRIVGESAPTEPRIALERAEVMRVLDPDRVLLRVGEVDVLNAEVAVPAYAPAAGDWVLVARESMSVFVLGVLGDARRRTVANGLSARADADGVELAAAGRLSLRSESAIEISAPLVRVAAGRVETEASVVFESAESSHRVVVEVASTSAGRVRTVVDDAYELTAERVRLVAAEDTVIDGKRVLLG